MIVFILFFTSLFYTSACSIVPQSTMVWCGKITKSNFTYMLVLPYLHMHHIEQYVFSKIMFLNCVGFFSEQIATFTFHLRDYSIRFRLAT